MNTRKIEDGMVPGLLFRVAPDELEKHLLERSDYHAARAKTKAAELPKLKEADEAIRRMPDMPKMSNTSNYAFNAEDAIERLEIDIKDHEAKSHKFRFMAEHLIGHEYCLDLSEMDLVELTNRIRR